jgi:hypothetical protein
MCGDQGRGTGSVWTHEIWSGRWRSIVLHRSTTRAGDVNQRQNSDPGVSGRAA